jgi:hypothetical protein
MADGHMVAIRTARSGQSPQMFYPVLDHLGSMAAPADGNSLNPRTDAKFAGRAAVGDGFWRCSQVHCFQV